MAIEKGDFIRIDYTGTVVETGDVFETTSQDIAEEVGIYDEKKKYKPFAVIVGAGFLLPALEEAIIGLDVGDNKKMTLEPEQAFGERNPELIQLFPMKEFKKQGITPVPGMTINSSGYPGKILTVSGGRVKVDFNNPLAGKALDYDITITEIIEDNEERVKSVIELQSSQNIDLDKTSVEFDEDTIKIKLDEMSRFDNEKSVMDITMERHRIAKSLYDNLPYEHVQFIDEFSKPEESDEEEEEIEENSEE